MAHSLSPVLHRAAYAALGLDDWSYQAIECAADSLPYLIRELDASWVGLSVTMPGKRAALAAASEATPRAVAVGAANTLVRRSEGGWRADCTDVDGVAGALRCAGGWTDPGTGRARALVLGAGGTACAALAGLAVLGVSAATVVVREPARATEALACGQHVGLAVDLARWDEVDWAAATAQADVVVSTVPAGAVDVLVERLAAAPCLLDVVYHPWPTPLAAAVAAAGGRLATGLDMLLHQAFGQVSQFTGHPAPRAAMRAALRAATGAAVELPIDAAAPPPNRRPPVP